MSALGSRERMYMQVTDEAELKRKFESVIGDDFFFRREVKGHDLVAQAGVRVDYLIYPKKHLIDNGFPEGYFAVEVKFFQAPKDSDNGKSYELKRERTMAQCVSYAHSTFRVRGRDILPLACLLHFAADDGYCDDMFGWVGMMAGVLRNLNVGIFSAHRNYPHDDAPYGWGIRFGGSLCRLYNTTSGLSGGTPRLGILRRYGSEGTRESPTKDNNFQAGPKIT